MNGLDIGLAFLEGLALVASPCILPVLPLVLGASVSGGRRRPYGIIVGFVVAFSGFAIAARKVVALLGVDIESIQRMSLVLLGLFGVMLLSGALSRRFGAWTQGAADLGNRWASAGARAGGGGFLGGVAIGSMIGLVWTPCAGPILAAVLVQVIRQRADWSGDLVVVSFGSGAALPMLAIALAGRALLGRMAILTAHAEHLRRGFGVLIIASAAYIASGNGAVPTVFHRGSEAAVASADSSTARDRDAMPMLRHALPEPFPAPEFSGIAAWLNSSPLTMAGLRGKVVLVDFWTYSCINCVRTLPYLVDWDRKYRKDGLVIVGVHAPEFEFEKRPENVQAAVARYGIRYPVALDSNLDTWTRFRNEYWPAHYLIDRRGRVVYTHFGEGEYGTTENNIRVLLGLDGKAEARGAAASVSPDQTPETYLGYLRGERFAGPQSIAENAPQSYRFPSALPPDSWALRGAWSVGPQHITAREAGASLRMRFTARKVFLVLGTSSGSAVRATIRLNGAPPDGVGGKDAPSGTVTIARDTLYELIDQPEVRDGVVEIRTDQPGLEAYAFTFGS